MLVIIVKYSKFMKIVCNTEIFDKIWFIVVLCLFPMLASLLYHSAIREILFFIILLTYIIGYLISFNPNSLQHLSYNYWYILQIRSNLLEKNDDNYYKYSLTKMMAIVDSPLQNYGNYGQSLTKRMAIMESLIKMMTIINIPLQKWWQLLSPLQK